MSGALRRIREAWDRFWFGPEAALNLAMARVLVCAQALWIFLSRDFAAVSGVGFAWVETSWGVKARFLIAPGHVGFDAVLQWAAIAALALGLVGHYPRVACFVAGVLTYHLAPLYSAFWDAVPYARGLTLAPAALLLLSASPCGDALTLRARRGPRPTPAGEYGWSLKLIQLLVCQIYLFAAWGKLVMAGLTWGSAESMRRWFLWAGLDPTFLLWRAPAMWLAGLPDVALWALGLGTLTLEWGFIAILFVRRLRPWVLPSAVFFHLLILVTINVHVPEVWLMLIFVDWDAVRQRFQRHDPSRAASAQLLRLP